MLRHDQCSILTKTPSVEFFGITRVKYFFFIKPLANLLASLENLQRILSYYIVHIRYINLISIINGRWYLRNLITCWPSKLFRPFTLYGLTFSSERKSTSWRSIQAMRWVRNLLVDQCHNDWSLPIWSYFPTKCFCFFRNWTCFYVLIKPSFCWMDLQHLWE